MIQNNRRRTWFDKWIQAYEEKICYVIYTFCPLGTRGRSKLLYVIQVQEPVYILVERGVCQPGYGYVLAAFSGPSKGLFISTLLHYSSNPRLR